ncbi:MAG: NAD(P)-dependent oxidoreductase [Candidatus Obscuribacterales bacterium]
MNTQTKNCLQPETFYPLSLSLKGQEVIVFGGDLTVAAELLRLLEVGAIVTVVSSAFVSEIQELHVTYGGRLELVRVSEVKYLEQCQDLARFSLVFALSANQLANERAAAIASSSRVPFYFVASAGCTFVPVTMFKRGHIKISVSSDGICPPLETALMQRIEEVLVNEFDRYSVFLDSVREQLSSESEAQSSGDILQTWSEINTSEALASALSRHNFEEALSIIQQLQRRSSLSEEAN